jgi:hypothetical protein
MTAAISIRLLSFPFIIISLLLLLFFVSGHQYHLLLYKHITTRNHDSNKDRNVIIKSINESIVVSSWRWWSNWMFTDDDDARRRKNFVFVFIDVDDEQHQL